MAWQNPNLSTNKTEERRQKDASNFQKMVQMLGMARQTDGQTMLGFALGKLLRGAYDNYLSKQYEAGQRATLHQPLTGEALQHEERISLVSTCIEACPSVAASIPVTSTDRLSGCISA